MFYVKIEGKILKKVYPYEKGISYYQQNMKQKNDMSIAIVLVPSHTTYLTVILERIPHLVPNNNVQNIIHHLIFKKSHQKGTIQCILIKM